MWQSNYHSFKCYWEAAPVFHEQQQVIFIYVLFSIFCKYLKSFNGLLYKGMLEPGLYFVLELKIKLISNGFYSPGFTVVTNIPEKCTFLSEE